VFASSIAVIVLTVAALAAALATLIWTWHVGQFDLEEEGGVVLPFDRGDTPKP
jgi:nitrogen fixation-related uncharacterized protein